MNASCTRDGITFTARVTLVDSWGREYALLNFQPLRPFAGKLRLGVEVVGVSQGDGLVTLRVCYTGSGFVEGSDPDAWPALVEEVQFKARLGAPDGAAVVLDVQT